jgi:hypothetical protein
MINALTLGHSSPILLILEDGVAISLLIIQDYWLKDSLHMRQFSREWQLALFHERGAVNMSDCEIK